MMNVVLQQFDMGAGTHNAYAQRNQSMFGGPVVANFKALDPYVTFVLNREYALPFGGHEMSCVQNCRLTCIASKSNKPIRRVAGCRDAHQFFVDSASHVDGTARPRSV